MQKIYSDRILKKLANLQLAITLLLVIGVVVALGTVIEQDQSVTFYQQNYTKSNPILGFLTWDFLLLLNLDHIYTSYWFLILLVIFALSLLSCTLTVQLPVLRRLRRWQFYKDVKKVTGFFDTVPLKMTNKFAYQLHFSKYTFFRQGKQNYAYSGLLGRLGPVVVHASIILLLLGSTIGSFGGYIVQELVPRGEFFHMQNIIKFGNQSNIPQYFSWRINDFWITYTEAFKTNQFYSDLSLLDNVGNELKRKTIFVNEPFVYKGLTVYQTDWDIVGLKCKRNLRKTTQLPLKKIVKAGQKFWFGAIRIESTSSPIQIFSIIVNDLSGRIYIYDNTGTLIQNAKLGELIMLTPTETITFVDFLTSTGLQIKADPGLRTVYLAFLFLMLSTYVSFISYSQLWGYEKSDSLVLTGNSNRAVLFFQTEFRKILEKTRF